MNLILARIPYRTVVLLLCASTALCWNVPATGATIDEQARAILAESDVSGGLIVHLGCADGRLTAALRVDQRYLVHGLDRNPDNVARARQHVHSLGLTGSVSVERLSGPHLPYIDNLVNLMVVEQLGDVSVDELLRVLVPDGEALIRQGDGWRRLVKARPKGLDTWPHFLHGADGNAVSQDTVVDRPRHLQWTGEPRYARTHEGVSTVNVVVSDGRHLFAIVDDGPVALPEQLPTEWALIARDAFNGLVTWKRPLKRWQARSAGSRHLYPPDLFRRLVAGPNHVYAPLDILGPVVALDSATGKTVRVFEGTEGAEEILYQDDVLYLAVNPTPQTIDRGELAHEWKLTVAKRVTAIAADTGRVLWAKTDADTTGLAPMSLTVAHGKVVFTNPREIVALNAIDGQVSWQQARSSPDTRPPWGTPTLVIAEDVVLCADRRTRQDRVASETAAGSPKKRTSTAKILTPRSELTAYDLESGKPLWSTPCAEGSHVPNEVFVIDGLVWAGEQKARASQDYRVGRDLHTGEVRRTVPPSQAWVGYHHHRCYRDKATSRFILAGRTGVEFVDIGSGQITPHRWIRGICKFGVLPCNGLLYVPPNQCSCYQESLLNGFNALAAEKSSDQSPESRAEDRLQRGPAYVKPLLHPSSLIPHPSADWPTYRGDAARSGSTSQTISAHVTPLWNTKIEGRLTAPVVAQGHVFLAARDRHTVYCLDASTGVVAWSYTAGGRVDSPPTVTQGIAVFGCRDGRVYALRAADGALLWKRLVAPEDERLVANGQLESVWPVHGSVLVDEKRVYCAAGRSSHLDGGVTCSILDLITGDVIAEHRYDSHESKTGQYKALYPPFAGALLPDRELPGVAPDVPATDGQHVYLRSVAFDRDFRLAKQYERHLFAANGFLDDAWYQRLFWIYGNHQFSGLAGRGFNSRYPSVGRILAHDERTVYGYRDYTLANEGVFAIDKTDTLGIFASDFPPSKQKLKNLSTAKKSRRATTPQERWHLSVPFYVRAMAVTGNALVLSGPPKHEPAEAHELIAGRPLDTIPPPPILQQALESWQGRQGGQLWIVDKTNGEKLAEVPLPAPPVHDGLAVAGGRLFLTTLAATVLSLSAADRTNRHSWQFAMSALETPRRYDLDWRSACYFYYS